MNIFEFHLKEIRDLVLKYQSELDLTQIDNLRNISLEIPPAQFNFDLSCNIAMILGKSNKLNPKDLAQKIKKLFLENITNFSEVEIASPGFINIKLSSTALLKNINLILKSGANYGSFKDNKNYNIEFVSANPTGPMHVGHCRGAIYGDVLSNLLKFNGNKVTKEYYINDYGNQIKNFIESVYFRIVEIAKKKNFPKKKNLYPGEYIKDIAKNILSKNNSFDFTSFEKSFNFLKKNH